MSKYLETIRRAAREQPKKGPAMNRNLVRLVANREDLFEIDAEALAPTIGVEPKTAERYLLSARALVLEERNR